MAMEGSMPIHIQRADIVVNIGCQISLDPLPPFYHQYSAVCACLLVMHAAVRMAQKNNTEVERDDASVDSACGQDICILIECLQFQVSSPAQCKPVFTTLANICSSSGKARDMFRSSGGLSYMCNLLFSTSSSSIKQAAMYTLGCAVEKNVLNQMKMCNKKLFELLSDVLKSSSNEETEKDLTLLTSAVFLSGCLMSSNVQGQQLGKETHLIDRLIILFRYYLPSLQTSMDNSSHEIDLWTSTCSALCVASNNPQNEINQKLCSQLFPAVLSLPSVPLQLVVRPAITLLSACVTNNSFAQDKLRMLGGLHILVSTLKGTLISLTKCGRESEESLEFPLHVVRTLSAAMFGHETNRSLVCSLKIIPSLLSLLQHKHICSDASLNIVICLGILIEDNDLGQLELISCNGLTYLLDLMANSSHDEELQKAITFVLQCSIKGYDSKVIKQEEIFYSNSSTISTTQSLPYSASFKSPVPLEKKEMMQSSVQTQLPTEIPPVNVYGFSASVLLSLKEHTDMLEMSLLKNKDGIQNLEQRIQFLEGDETFVPQPALDTSSHSNNLSPSSSTNQSEGFVANNVQQVSSITSEDLHAAPGSLIYEPLQLSNIKLDKAVTLQFKSDKHSTSVPITSQPSKMDHHLHDHNFSTSVPNTVSESSHSNDHNFNTSVPNTVSESSHSNDHNFNTSVPNTVSASHSKQLVLQPSKPLSRSVLYPKLSSSSSQPTAEWCLGCKSRSDNNLLTSKNFIAELRTDCYTCDFHRRFIGRIIACMGHTNREKRSDQDISLENQVFLCDTDSSQTIAKSSLSWVQDYDSQPNNSKLNIEHCRKLRRPVYRNLRSVLITPVKPSIETIKGTIEKMSMTPTSNIREKINSNRITMQVDNKDHWAYQYDAEGNTAHAREMEIFPGRKKWTKEEEENLKRGIKLFGHGWQLILKSFSFYPKRTATDLKDKHRNMMKQYC